MAIKATSAATSAQRNRGVKLDAVEQLKATSFNADAGGVQIAMPVTDATFDNTPLQQGSAVLVHTTTGARHGMESGQVTGQSARQSGVGEARGEQPRQHSVLGQVAHVNGGFDRPSRTAHRVPSIVFDKRLPRPGTRRGSAAVRGALLPRNRKPDRQSRDRRAS
jgi:hypothetical protein